MMTSTTEEKIDMKEENIVKVTGIETEKEEDVIDHTTELHHAIGFVIMIESGIGECESSLEIEIVAIMNAIDLDLDLETKSIEVETMAKTSIVVRTTIVDQIAMVVMTTDTHVKRAVATNLLRGIM